MRNFDNWLEYLVDGKPFFGRFTFFKLHTTEKITITSESGVALSNPILSDAYGRTSSHVFLPDEDVTVLMESFIGSGEMSDNAENISAWKEERTFDSLNNSVIIDVDGDTVVASMAGNVTELRGMDPKSCNYAMLCGYYNIGDMPPAFYKLEYNQTTADTGGDIHRIDTEHIWRLVKPQVLDIRIFGVFPANNYNTVSPEASNIANAFAYANTNGISVYMPQVYATGGWYGFEGGNYTLRQTLYLDHKTHIVGKTRTSSSLYLNKVEGGTAGFMYWHESYNLGNLEVSVESVRSSWLNNWNQDNYTLVPRKELIIDSQIIRRSLTISDLQHVYIEQQDFNPPNRITFSRIIDFESPGRISLDAPISFQYMTEIKDSWWALTSSNHKLSTTNVNIANSCTMYLDDFLYVENFCIFQYLNGVKTFNLDGRAYNASITDRFDSCTFMNGEISNLHLTGTVTLRNIKGSVYTNPAAAWTDISIEDSYITGSLPFNITGNVYIKSSSFISTLVTGSSLPAFHGNSCVIRDSIFNGYIIQVPYNAVITGCTFDKNSQGAYSNVTAYSNVANGHLSITFSDNVLNGAKLNITRSSSQLLITVVKSVFVGNAITDSRDGTNFITWASGSMAPSGHTYSYRNNDGPNVLQQDSYTTVLKNVPMWHNDGSTPPSTLYIEYTDPERIFHMGGISVISGYTTTVLPSGGVIVSPNYTKTDDANTYARKSRLVGLTIEDFNIFCFSNNDFISKYIALSVSIQKREGQENNKILDPNISINSVGIPEDLSLPSFSTNNPSASSSSEVPVPDVSEDLVLQVSLTDVRVIS